MTRRHRTAALCAGMALAALVLAPPASARVGVFFGFAPPVYYPPPAYYAPPPFYYAPPAYYAPPPPVYYTPPPAAYAPPPYDDRPSVAATTCYAGAFVCPMQSRVSIGATCWCPDNTGARAYGRAG
ncbi:MAG: hypothetical protein ABI224_05220 [Acetobacteraceae bacterium]